MSSNRLLCYESRDTARGIAAHDRRERWLTAFFVLVLAIGIILTVRRRCDERIPLQVRTRRGARWRVL